MIARARVAMGALGLLVVMSLAGCTQGGPADELAGGPGPDPDHGNPSDGTDPAPPPGGNGSTGNDTGARLEFSATPATGQTPLNVTFHANVTFADQAVAGGNATDNSTDANDTTGVPYTGDLTWTLSYGVGSNNSSGDQDDFLIANFTYAEGNHTAELSVLLEDGQSLTSSVDIAAIAGNGTGNGTNLTGPEPEGGQVEGTTTGATAQAIIGRTPFTIETKHTALEIVPFLNDPLATELGQSYTVRLTPPSGGDDDHVVSNGDTIIIDDPEVGTWEIGVFMVAAGSYSWTADWCAFTQAHCEEGEDDGEEE